MRPIVLLLAVCLQLTNAYGQKLQPVTVNVEFRVNGTSATMTVPPGFTVITDPQALKAFPYPENQNLYFVMKPPAGHESRHIAIGSRPELDAQDISIDLCVAIEPLPWHRKSKIPLLPLAVVYVIRNMMVH